MTIPFDAGSPPAGSSLKDGSAHLAMTHFYQTFDHIFQSAAEQDSPLDSATLLQPPGSGMITLDFNTVGQGTDLLHSHFQLLQEDHPPHKQVQQQEDQEEEDLEKKEKEVELEPELELELELEPDIGLERHSSKPQPVYNTRIGAALQRNITAWCEATGLPTSITLYVGDRVFKLHKYPLVSKSGYLKRMLAESKELHLPADCPGGSDVLELALNFCYGSTILMDPSNVAALRCAAEFLEMTNQYGRGNLCERSDVYLTQVALQSWEDTVMVLLQCHSQALLPMADHLRIVSRCVRALARMAALELMDPAEREREREQEQEQERERQRSSSRGSGSGSGSGNQFWRDFGASKRMAMAASCCSRDWWVKDLLCLPFGLFERVVAAMREQGMEEHHVTQVVIKYAEKHVFQAMDRESTDDAGIVPQLKRGLVEGTVRLLPPAAVPGSAAEEEEAGEEDEECGGRGLGDLVPVGFLFALLRCALACEVHPRCLAQLERMIAAQLECATINDYLLPCKAAGAFQQTSVAAASELKSMHRILGLFLSRWQPRHRHLHQHQYQIQLMQQHGPGQRALMKVAKVWDQYLGEIGADAGLTAGRFLELAEVIPASARSSHDLLYKAIHVFLKAHPRTTEEERSNMCRMLNCQRLSQEMCSHAVQNELMPLRMLVQAMFLQQLQTRNTLCEHLQSVSASGRLDSRVVGLATASFRKSNVAQQLQQAMQQDAQEEEEHEEEVAAHAANNASMASPGPPQEWRVLPHQQAALLKADYEATYSRLRNLEEELARMRHNLEAETGSQCGQWPEQGHQRQESSDTQCRSSSGRDLYPGVGKSGRMSKKEVQGQGGSGNGNGSNSNSSSGCLGHSGLALSFSRTLHRLGLTGGGSFWKSSKSKKKSSNSSRPELDNNAGAGPAAAAPSVGSPEWVPTSSSSLSQLGARSSSMRYSSTSTGFGSSTTRPRSRRTNSIA